MTRDGLLAVVLPPLAAAVATALTAQSGTTDVYNSEIQCGKVIAAIYGQIKPEGE